MVSWRRVPSFLKPSPGLPTPREQLLGTQPMAPRHLRYADAGLEAFHNDAGLVLARPRTAAARTRDELDPTHLGHATFAPVTLASKLTLKRNVKIIAHGSALRHNPDKTDMWEGSSAYLGLTPSRPSDLGNIA
jgi:hypothetical protein